MNNFFLNFYCKLSKKPVVYKFHLWMPQTSTTLLGKWQSNVFVHLSPLFWSKFKN